MFGEKHQDETSVSTAAAAASPPPRERTSVPLGHGGSGRPAGGRGTGSEACLRLGSAPVAPLPGPGGLEVSLWGMLKRTLGLLGLGMNPAETAGVTLIGRCH